MRPFDNAVSVNNFIRALTDGFMDSNAYKEEQLLSKQEELV